MLTANSVQWAILESLYLPTEGREACIVYLLQFSHETITTELRALEQKGYIEFHRNKFSVSDKGLIAIAEYYSGKIDAMKITPKNIGKPDEG